MAYLTHFVPLRQQYLNVIPIDNHLYDKYGDQCQMIRFLHITEMHYVTPSIDQILLDATELCAAAVVCVEYAPHRR